MKAVRLDYSGGINVITDKSVLPDRFATVLDNVDMRSGFPRTIREPLFHSIVSNSTYQPQLSSTKKIFNYRGRWIYSDYNRDYVAQYINGIERIYWNDIIDSYTYSGTNNLVPQKMIEGTQVRLGTPKPTSKPIVTAGTTIVPKILSTTVSTGVGGIIPGTYYYAVSAVYNVGISPPSNIVSATIPPAASGSTANPNRNITIEWGKIPDAIGYIVWGRSSNYSSMNRITKMDASNLSYLDNGQITPSNDNPQSYFDSAPITYIYTYERNVEGLYNESGVSEISDAIQTTTGRNIARDVYHDGFFNQTETVSLDASNAEFTVTPSNTTYPQIGVTGWRQVSTPNQVVFTTPTQHFLQTDDYVVFTGTNWKSSTYKNQKYQVVVIDDHNFAIQNIAPPQQIDIVAGGIVNDGFEFTGSAGGYSGSPTTNLPLTTISGVGTGGTVDITFGQSHHLFGPIKSVTVHTAGNNYKVGDYVSFTVEDVPLPIIVGGDQPEGFELGSSSISILNSGSGYLKPGSISAFEIINYGSGYTANTTFNNIALTGGSGSGATISFSTNELGVPYEVRISNAGGGYDYSADLGISAGGGSGFSLRPMAINSGVFQNIDVTGGTGVGAKANVTTNSSGSIAAIEMVDSGSGYNLGGSGGNYGLGGGLGSGTNASFTANYYEISKIVITMKITSVDGLNTGINLAKTRVTINQLSSSKMVYDNDALSLNLTSQTAGAIVGVLISNPGLQYTNGTYTNVSLTGGNGLGAKATITVANKIVTSCTITNGGGDYLVGDILNGVFGGGTGFIATVATLSTEGYINGLFKAKKIDAYGVPIQGISTFDIPTYTKTWTNPCRLTATAMWTPKNGYYNTWNLYRTGSGGIYQLVKKIDISQLSYSDTTSKDYLGGPPTSYYIDNGVFGPVTILFSPPPNGLTCLTEHYGMLFGVDGHRVRWTPIGQPDAWPDVYYYDFSYKPIALASYGTSLVVLCEDALYLIDGNAPSSMSLSKSKCEDGCIAPFSVQATNKGLVFLSNRGLMLFNGMEAVCLTDSKIPSFMLIGPSKLDSPINFWWYPTKLGFFYGNFANNDGVLYRDTASAKFYRTNETGFPNYEITSAYHYGKYYLVYTGRENYEAHTTLVVDLQAPGVPITTLGLKPVDIIVNELEEMYILVDNQGTQDPNNMIYFKAQNSEVEPQSNFASNPGLSIYKMLVGKSSMPLVVRSGVKGFESRTERKRFGQLEFFGNGTLSVRVYIDGVFIANDQVTLAEAPTKPRKMNLPRGYRVGYTIDFEIYGDCDKLVTEFTYDSIRGVS